MTEAETLRRRGPFLSHDAEEAIIVGNDWPELRFRFRSSQSPLQRIQDVFQPVVHVMFLNAFLAEIKQDFDLQPVVIGEVNAALALGRAESHVKSTSPFETRVLVFRNSNAKGLPGLH